MLPAPPWRMRVGLKRGLVVILGVGEGDGRMEGGEGIYIYMRGRRGGEEDR